MKRLESAAMVALVAEHLGSLNEEVLFLGGAVLGLLITDPGAPSIRYNMDLLPENGATENGKLSYQGLLSCSWTAGSCLTSGIDLDTVIRIGYR
jgi:hypothetical protein